MDNLRDIARPMGPWSREFLYHRGLHPPLARGRACNSADQHHTREPICGLTAASGVCQSRRLAAVSYDHGELVTLHSTNTDLLPRRPQRPLRRRNRNLFQVRGGAGIERDLTGEGQGSAVPQKAKARNGPNGQDSGRVERKTLGRLHSPEDDQNQEHEQDGSDGPAGPVAPASAIRPRWYRADEREDKEDQKKCA